MPPDGSITGIRHHWAFDDMFSAFATQGIASKEKGKFTREELAPLAKTNIESLKEYKYFNYATADGQKALFRDPLPDYWLDYKDSILVLNFTLPFKTPVKAKFCGSRSTTPPFSSISNSPRVRRCVWSARRRAASSTWCCRRTSPPRNRRSWARPSSIRCRSAQNWGAQFANKILVNCP